MEEDRLEVAKKLYKSGSYDEKTIEAIFPEIKKLKDERIINALLNFVKDYSKGTYLIDSSKKVTRKEAIDWLESLLLTI